MTTDDAERQFEALLNERNVYRAALTLASGALKKNDDRGKTANRLQNRIERAQTIIDEALRHHSESA